MGLSVVPHLSIIIASYNSKNTIFLCLESLQRQKTKKNFEIIVVDSSTDNTSHMVKQRFSDVKVYSFKKRKYCGDARNFGMTVARADIIAFLDADCTVDNNWVDKVLAAHETEYLAVGGTIENGDKKHQISWAYYLCEFNLWLPSRQKREISEAAGCCLSIKRRAFDSYGPFVEGTYSSDTAFHWNLCKDNHRVLYIPSVKVYHTARYTFRAFVRHIYSHRRQFARLVITEKRISGLRRAAMVLYSPFSPPILFVAIMVRVLMSEVSLFYFLCSTPLIVAGIFSRAWGEFVGFARQNSR